MDITSLVTPLTRQTLRGDVYLQLRDLLMNGRVMPGEVLSLRSIAEALEVSVMPVREAVHRLVAEQALELTANRTLRVPAMTVSQFREITAIRINLECMATGKAATLLNQKDFQTIESIHNRFSNEISLAQPDGSRLIALNKELHFEIYSKADMPMLLQMIEPLWLRIGPILNYDLRSNSLRVKERTPASHHSLLIDALRIKDSTAAIEAMRDDIQSASDYIISTGELVSTDEAKTTGK
jgi:DNA-binding GntR family transcriptional regulator